MSGHAEDIRKDVSKSYGQAMSKPTSGGCCGPAEASARKELAIELAGYSEQDLSGIPEGSGG